MERSWSSDYRALQQHNTPVQKFADFKKSVDNICKFPVPRHCKRKHKSWAPPHHLIHTKGNWWTPNCKTTEHNNEEIRQTSTRSYDSKLHSFSDSYSVRNSNRTKCTRLLPQLQEPQRRKTGKIFIHGVTKKLNFVAWVRKRTIPTDWATAACRRS
jgi:hypothetical protein